MTWRLSRRLCAFRSDDSGGTSTISFVLWLPFVMTVFLVFTDMSFVLYKRSDIVRVVEDVNRARAIGQITTDAQTERAVLVALGYDPDALAAAPVPGLSVTTDTTLGVQSTVVRIPMAEIDGFGVFESMAGNFPVIVESRQLIENWEG